MRWGAALILLLGCGASDQAAQPELGPDAGAVVAADAEPDPEPVLYPDPDWPEGAPGDHGLDAAGLTDAANYADSIGSRCLLVIRDGRLVFERYFNGSSADELQRTWSIAKSFTTRWWASPSIAGRSPASISV